MTSPINLAVELAKEIGEIQMESFGSSHQVEFKGVIDIVTEVDKKCEKIIVDRIKKVFPSHDVMAEEGTGERKDHECRWIIDPLDATVNYNHGYPFFGTSIAMEKNGELVLGVVNIPCRNELFIAEKGGGAELGGKKISVSSETKVINSLLSTGFAYNVQEDQANNLDNFGRFIMKARAIRRDGMAAGDLCYLACGRFDGFWELFLKPWDIAAGILMIEEAGGKVTNFTNGKIDVYGIEILASNGRLHKEMMEILAQGGK